MPTRAVRDDLVVRGLLDAERITLIASAADLSLFKPQPQLQVRTALRVPPAAFVLVVPADVHLDGIKAISSALVMLRSKRVNLRVVVLGAATPEWLAEAQARGIEASLTATGPLGPQAFAQWLCAADVALATALSETAADDFLLAAQACGVVALATDTPAHRELVTESSLLTPLESSELAMRLELLVAQPTRRQVLGDRARLAVQLGRSWAGRSDELAKALSGLAVPVSSPVVSFSR